MISFIILDTFIPNKFTKSIFRTYSLLYDLGKAILQKISGTN